MSFLLRRRRAANRDANAIVHPVEKSPTVPTGAASRHPPLALKFGGTQTLLPSTGLQAQSRSQLELLLHSEVQIPDRSVKTQM